MSDHLVTYLVKWADKGCSAPDEKECRDAFPDARDWCRACFATEILQWKEAEVEKFLRAAATAGASVPPPQCESVSAEGQRCILRAGHEWHNDGRGTRFQPEPSDPLAGWLHQQLGKGEAMTKPSMDLYPPVTMPAGIPTWEDIELLSLHYPAIYQAVSLHHRGDLTREQALSMMVFVLADAFQRLFSAEVDRRNTTLPDRFVIPPDPRS